MTCPHCNEKMEGDGYTVVFHCPNSLDYDYKEPDAPPVHCNQMDLL